MLKYLLRFTILSPVVTGLFLPCAYAATFNGPWVQGAMVTGTAAAGEQVVFHKKTLQQGPKGEFVLGLGRDAPAQVTVLVRKANGTTETLSFAVKQRTYDVQRIKGVEQKHVDPPAELTERITREAAAVNKVRKRNDARTDFLGPFIWPAKGPITGVYGSQRYYNGTPKNPHFGLDIAGPKGAPVIAPAAGVVTFANNDLFFSGGTLIVDHGHGVSSTFIHLSKIEVAVGTVVNQGDLIARIGASGRATGPHLDWRMNWFEERLDPQLLFPAGAKPAIK